MAVVGWIAVVLVAVALAVRGAVGWPVDATLRAVDRGDIARAARLVRWTPHLRRLPYYRNELLRRTFVRGDTAMLVALREAGLDVVRRSEQYGSPLSDAASCCPAAVPLLLAWGADANGAPGDSMAPLHQAAMRGDVETLRLLLDHGADPNAGIAGKRSLALGFAVQRRHRPCIDLLLAHGAEAQPWMVERCEPRPGRPELLAKLEGRPS